MFFEAFKPSINKKKSHFKILNTFLILSKNTDEQNLYFGNAFNFNFNFHFSR